VRPTETLRELGGLTRVRVVFAELQASPENIQVMREPCDSNKFPSEAPSAWDSLEGGIIWIWRGLLVWEEVIFF